MVFYKKLYNCNIFVQMKNVMLFNCDLFDPMHNKGKKNHKSYRITKVKLLEIKLNLIPLS